MHAPSRTRAAMPALLAVAATLTLAACGGSGGAATTHASSTTPTGATRTFDRAKLAACLKQQGVRLPARRRGGTPNGGPPGPGRFFGSMSSAQRAKLQAALQKCGAPFGGRLALRRRFDARNPAFRAALTRFVACVRRHGFNLPAPNTSGNGPVFDPHKVNRSDPRFLAASRTCQGLLAPGFGQRPPAAGGAPGA
jgi:hypothetical protein